MMTETDILAAMDRFGGSFIKQLAVLYRVADDINKQKLRAAFRDYFIEYDKLENLLERHRIGWAPRRPPSFDNHE